jgi:hypothetical protein
MDCLICGADAKQIQSKGDLVSIFCPMCDEYDISNSVIASGQLRGLTPEERGDVLLKARRSALLSARPMITPYLLA